MVEERRDLQLARLHVLHYRCTCIYIMEVKYIGAQNLKLRTVWPIVLVLNVKPRLGNYVDVFARLQAHAKRPGFVV